MRISIQQMLAEQALPCFLLALIVDVRVGMPLHDVPGFIDDRITMFINSRSLTGNHGVKPICGVAIIVFLHAMPVRLILHVVCRAWMTIDVNLPKGGELVCGMSPTVWH
jgi:hypothetical protein